MLASNCYHIPRLISENVRPNAAVNSVVPPAWQLEMLRFAAYLESEPCLLVWEDKGVSSLCVACAPIALCCRVGACTDICTAKPASKITSIPMWAQDRQTVSLASELCTSSACNGPDSFVTNDAIVITLLLTEPAQARTVPTRRLWKWIFPGWRS